MSKGIKLSNEILSEADRNARAYGYEIGCGHPLVHQISMISNHNPFLDTNWRAAIKPAEYMRPLIVDIPAEVVKVSKHSKKPVIIIGCVIGYVIWKRRMVRKVMEQQEKKVDILNDLEFPNTI